MSGVKWSPFLLMAIAYEEIEFERRRLARTEAQQRNTVEYETRQQRLDEVRASFRRELENARQRLQQAPVSLPVEETAWLWQRLERAQTTVEHAIDERELWRVSPEIQRILTELSHAAFRQQWQNQAAKNQDREQFRLAELEHRLAAIPEAEAVQFDVDGHRAALEALAIARNAFAQSNLPAITDEPRITNHQPPIALARAEEAVRKHLEQVTQGRDAWQHRLAEAQHAIGEMRALIAGLRADPIVLRWHANAVAGLEAQADAAEEAINAGALDQPAALLAEARERAPHIVEEANQAQIQADQRDYVVRGISYALEEMGFVVGEAQAEVPGHPATAMILRAASPAGKGIAVSVPAQGEVWYSVDGYTRKTEALVGGGEAVACDEAEQVLCEMHERLEEEFGVKMGELMWENKPPNRALRKADALPSSAGTPQQVSAR